MLCTLAADAAWGQRQVLHSFSVHLPMPLQAHPHRMWTCPPPPLALPSPCQVISFCREKGIEFVIVGPEQPLVEGLVSGPGTSAGAVTGCVQPRIGRGFGGLW